MLATDIVEPDLLAVGRVQEGHAVLALQARLLLDASRIPFGLGQDALRPNGQLLGLDDRKDSLRDA
ncbi:MAG: hypothetical protein WKF96_23350 [Solirubrobacteraceae bacterium]